MCGIAGILSPGPIGPAQRTGLTAMQTALRHRGPDGEGEWLSPCGTVAFAHTRLAIFDRTPAGHQPMSIDDGRLTITYNGAIYNFEEIRRGLERDGVRFASKTDTEVILRLYEQRGRAGLEQLQGMFALALWDASSRTGLLARDRFGIKPLYYATAGGRLVFASEVRALLQSRLVDDTLDPAGVHGYLLTGSVPEPRTLLRDVVCLPAGHYLEWSEKQSSLEPYWQLSFDEAGDDRAVPETRRALAASVDRHFGGDAPVGLFLSSGIDSTAILALAHAAGHRGIKTFALSFPESPNDEGPLAAKTAAHFGALHHTLAMDATAARSALDGYVAAMDQPSIDGLNTFVMSRFARDNGVTAVLSGLGADELFGGYPTFTGVPRLAAWHDRFRWTGAMGEAVGRVAEMAAPGVRPRRVADMLSRPPSLANAYQAYRGIFTHSEATALVAHFLGRGASTPELAFEPATDRSSADGVSRLELTRYVRNQLLRDGDVMSMASGLELRTPFLDADVVATLAGIPASVRLEPGKGLLRRAVPELPAWVAGQPKRVFQFPFARWINGEWGDTFAAQQRGGIPLGTWYRKWCVFSLESWMSKLNQASHV